MRERNHFGVMLIGAALVAAAACTAPAREDKPAAGAAPVSKEAAAATAAERLAAAEAALPENPMKEAYFGETHMHTALSLDALIGMTASGYRMPDDAYRFAQGAEMEISGIKHKTDRPLDFAAVSDHAEYIGESYSAMTPGAPGFDSPDLQQLRAAKTKDDQDAWYGKFSVNQRAATGPQHPSYYAGPETTRSAWRIILDAAEKNYVPGRFTTLPAFEWSSVVGGGNLHRNVFFRDMKVPDLPFSAVDSTDETKLWEWMAAQEAKGSKLLAIPHNTNAGKGLMFPGTYPGGKPIDAPYAQLRNRFERLVEVMQVKGNSEVHRNFWTADEFAGFENADSMANYAKRIPMKENFVRWGLIQGLVYDARLGTNPFQLGMGGGTDNHNGAMGDVVESNFIGGHGAADNSVVARRTLEVPAWLMAKDENPGALTGVWAARNTRAAIWDAMHARETFATSGPRIKVRMFAGAELPANPTDPKALVTDGYGKGVPMGGTLPALTKAPTFVVYAEKDAPGANLDRIQIIKGWVDAKGESHERIVDVVWGGERKKGANGKLPPVGNTVDLKTATYTNSIGAAVLMGSWTDDHFDARQNALYYARVLEIPTPRWTTYDAVRAGLPLLKDAPATIQERAWTSSIWYMPAK